MSTSQRGRIALDVLVVVVVLIDGVLSTYWTPTPWGLPLTALAVAGVVLRHRLPWLALLLTLPVVIVLSAVTAPLVALFELADSRVRRAPLAVAAFAVFAATATEWLNVTDPRGTVLGAVYAALAVAAPIALGLLDSARRELARRFDDLRRARDEEQRRAEQDAIAAERVRIAREMHDVVSHQVSLIAVRSGAMQVTARSDQDREALRLIRRLAVGTLDELRQMVTVLRVGEPAVEDIAPQPRIEDIPELVRRSEIETDLALRLPDDLAPALQRTVYRTVQEALTNIRKHAPGASATIRGITVAEGLQLEVRNPIRAADAALGLPASGYGLIGLRERAELVGGSLSTTVTDTHFSLQLRLPRTTSSS